MSGAPPKQAGEPGRAATRHRTGSGRVATSTAGGVRTGVAREDAAPPARESTADRIARDMSEKLRNGSGQQSRRDADSRLDEFRRVTGAAMRAMSREPELQVHFGAEGPRIAGNDVQLPAPNRALPAEDVAQIRGHGDAVALKLRYHDGKVHSRAMPAGAVSRDVYNALEQARCEAMGARRMLGVRGNLRAALAEQCRLRGYGRITGREESKLADVVGLLAREALWGDSPPDTARAMVDAWRPWIESRIGPDFHRLAEVVDDQEVFARLARRIISELELGEDLLEEDEDDEGEGDQDQAGDQSRQDAEDQSDDDSANPGAMGSLSDQQPDASDMDDAEAGEPQDMDMQLSPDGGDEEVEQSGTPQRREPDFRNIPGEPPYHAYTTAFDQLIEAHDLCDSDELARLRLQLDQQLQHLQSVIARLANRLQRRLMARQQRSWHFDLDEGMLDAARLARVIANPMNPLTYKMESETPFRDTVVSLLIDNSGSMRGRPITVAAMSADILARTLERCGVKVEILGFTTKAWKGGQARERWIADGKSGHPGRLNDLRHIIYKSADAPWRRARRNLGLMLREGLLKENIDGEALLWAHTRLLARPEQRRILMVISDGAPVDDSTLSVNAGNYLERHLRAVIEWIEKFSTVELVAIGIGHDVTRYYQRAVTLVDAEQLGGTMMDQLAGLFDEDQAQGKAQARR
ncbi:MAG: cobaltochelatase subunit CobT [Alphaproteobacteria bacterium]